MSLLSTTTPLGSAGTWTSTTQSLTRATQITGSVLADQNGTCYVDQSGDGTNFDITTKFAITANVGLPLEVDVISQWFRVRFVNGSVAQNALRLFIDIRDPYGDFLLAQSGPSSGGSWAVLYKDPARGYQYLGRFDGTDGWNANGNAAISTDKSGQYASFPVSNATVTQETLQTTTEHTPASY